MGSAYQPRHLASDLGTARGKQDAQMSDAYFLSIHLKVVNIGYHFKLKEISYISVCHGQEHIYVRNVIEIQ